MLSAVPLVTAVGEVARTFFYRFVHTPGSPGNGPEMLGAPKPESEGFSAQPHTGLRRLDAPTQLYDVDV